MSVSARRIDLPTPSGNGYNSKWIFRLVNGWNYHVLDFVTNLDSASTLTSIVLKLGSRTLQTISGEKLKMLEAFDAKHAEKGRFVLELSKFQYRLPTGIYLTGLQTGAGDNVTIELNFAQKSATDPDVLSVSASALVNPNAQAQLLDGGRSIEPNFYNETPFVGAAGRFVLQPNSRSPNLIVQRLIFDERETQVESIEVRRGDIPIHTVVRRQEEFDSVRYASKALQAGFFIVDFTKLGFGTDGENTNGINYVLHTTSTGSLNVDVEGYEITRRG